MNTNLIKFNFTNSRFTPDDTAKGIFMFLVLQTLVTLIYQVLYMLGFVQTIWSYVFTLIMDFCFVGCVYGVCKAKNTNIFENIKVKKAPSLKQVFICLGISLICIFGFSALTNLFLEVLYRTGYTSVSSDIVIPNFGYYLLYVGLICVIPAITEEVLFRGLIANGLKKAGTLASVLGSSFLFMIMHGSPDQTVHQFILGIILAIAYLISNNLWVPILIHFFNNFIAVTFSFIAYGDSASTGTETAQMFLGEYFIYAVISAVVSVVLVYVLFKLLSKNTTNCGEVEPVETRQNGVGERVSNDGLDGVTGSVENEGNNDVKDPVFVVSENKLSGTGKAMYVISIVWLVIDWVSALVLGFTQF